MSAIHILDSDGNGNYRAVLHTATPGTNNSAGLSWSAVIVAAGLNTTVLTEGNGIGQITTTEKTAVTAGTTMEVVVSLPVESNAATGASIDALALAAVNAAKAALQTRYKYFGFTRG